MLNADSYILLWINGHAADWLDLLMWYVSKSSTWIPLYVLLVGCIAWRFRNWKAILLILLAFAVAVDRDRSANTTNISTAKMVSIELPPTVVNDILLLLRSLVSISVFPLTQPVNIFL